MTLPVPGDVFRVHWPVYDSDTGTFNKPGIHQAYIVFQKEIMGHLLFAQLKNPRGRDLGYVLHTISLSYWTLVNEIGGVEAVVLKPPFKERLRSYELVRTKDWSYNSHQIREVSSPGVYATS